MRILYLDCSSGASGDMLLGALSEAAGSPEPLREAIAALGVPELSVRHRKVLRAGVGATKIDVLIGGREPADPGLVRAPAAAGARHEHGAGHPHHQTHEHKHDHPHDHPHDHTHTRPDTAAAPGGAAGHDPRTLAGIEEVLSRSRLSEPVRRRALAVFRRIVEAEAEVHRMPPAEVHLHEVGSLDAIADVAGTAALLERLAPDRIVCSPVNVGGGSVACAHGVYPVPGPATALLLRGVPIYSSGPDGELTTPTGAALLATLADEFGPLPLMRPSAIGHGAGGRDTPPRPNVLRAFLGESAAPGRAGEVVVVECSIDDMNPQNYGYLMERLGAAGAAEVFFTPIQMKKNRPGVLVTALCEEARLGEIAATLFGETTTIGLRYRRESRRELERRWEEVRTPFGAVRVKVCGEGGSVLSAQPEFEDCRRVAEAAGVPLKEVQAAAIAAWRAASAEGPERGGGRDPGRRGGGR